MQEHTSTPAQELDTDMPQAADTTTQQAETQAETQVEPAEAPADQALEKAQAEALEWKDKYLRLYSEFENFRRRTQREKADLILTAGEGVLTKILPVLDDLDRAEKANANTQDVQVVKEGMALVHHKLRQTLEQQGVKPMNATGTAFNPDLHEAITQVPAPTPEQAGTVLDEVEKGYFLHEKPIRYAKVVIAQ